MAFLAAKLTLEMVDTEIIKGEDREWEMHIKADGAIQDLTDIDAAVLKLKSSSGADQQLTLAASELVKTNATAGILKAVLSDTKSALLRSGAVSYQLELSDGSDKRIIQVSGKLTVKEGL